MMVVWGFFLFSGKVYNIQLYLTSKLVKNLFDFPVHIFSLLKVKKLKGNLEWVS